MLPEYRELLTEHEVLDDELPMATEEANQRTEPEQKQVEHGADLSQTELNPSFYVADFSTRKSLGEGHGSANAPFSMARDRIRGIAQKGQLQLSSLVLLFSMAIVRS